MSARLQHETADKALTVIGQEAKAGRKLNYVSLAEALGKGKTHARAIAQVCDLLDSAAIIVQRPLMALSTVLNSEGVINPRAWAINKALRDELIAEAKAHQFTDADEVATRNGLGQLVGMGNGKAWKYVLSLIPEREMLARLRGQEPSPQMDSLNDLGSDQPNLIATTGHRFFRDHGVRAAVMKRAGGAYEFCGTLGFERSDNSHYLECHHIIA